MLATAKLTGPGVAETRFSAATKVELWSDFEGKWEGRGRSLPMPLAYDIEVIQGGEKVGQVICSTAGASTKVCSSAINTTNEHSGDCEVRMNCELPAVRPGEVLLRVTGRVSDPARVQQVNKMSLNVRAR